MDALVPILVVLSFLLLGVGIFVVELFVARRRLREVRIVRCPAVARPAALRLHAGRAAVEEALGREPELAVEDCTRWPRAKGCDQQCLEQLAANPDEATLAHRVHSWMAERVCSACGESLDETKLEEIFLVSPLGTRFEWDELPPDWLAEAIESWQPLCGGCGRGASRTA